MKRSDSKFRTILGVRELRKRMTPSEKLLWTYLSDRGMVKVKFRRQHPISGFILDFFCPTRNLAIELDGGIHANRVEYDREREEVLRSLGITILRFSNDQVINSLDSVLKTIKRTLFPSPRSGEGCRDAVAAG